MGTPIFTEGFIEAFNEDPGQFVGITYSEREALELFDEHLDECYDWVKICGMEYDPSRAWKVVDPIAYRCAFNDFVSQLEEDHRYVEGITYPPNS